MDDVIDLLQVKIERAREKLSAETRHAIDAVPWKEAIVGLREKKGYSIEQLGDLELETELVLCGLLSPADYPRELEKRMRISRTQTDTLVNEMNELVFQKIREELMKTGEPRKESVNSPQEARTMPKIVNDAQVLSSAGINIVQKPIPQTVVGWTEEKKAPEAPIEKREEMLERVENPVPVKPIIPAPQQRPPTIKTETPAVDISKTPELASGVQKTAPVAPAQAGPSISSYPPKADPYRLSPD